ncbi:MAG: Fic family protein [Armatimonadetes bacterium]|nr:Fic family protein [Armatimonadota bacterium]
MQTWEPIQDLKPGWEEFASTELAGLKDAWREHRERLQGTKALEKFNKEQARQWSIETGIIENLYHIDRGITQMLVEKGLEASYIPHGTTHKSSEEIIRLLRDHQATLEGLHTFIRQERSLSTSYIKELHQALTRHQKTCDAYDQFGNLQQVALLRGEWKKYPNNPSREDGVAHCYCPPEQVQSEMDSLIELHLRHVEEQVPPEIEAAWLHHRFTQIHPFQDGNGRVARTLASLIFLRDNWFPLTIDRDQSIPYLDALEEVLMEEMEKPSIEDAVAAIGNHATALTQVKQTLALLEGRTKSGFGETQKLLAEQASITDWKFLVTESQDKRRVSLRFSSTTKESYYEILWTHTQTEYTVPIVVEVKADFKILVMALRPVHNPQKTREEQAWDAARQNSLSPSILSPFAREIKKEPRLEYSNQVFPDIFENDTFRFGSVELPENVLKRYDKWLDAAIIAGLNEWRKHL